MAPRTKFKTWFTRTDDALRDQPPPGNRRIAVPPPGPGERPAGPGDARARGLDRVAEVRSGFPARASGRRPGAAAAAACGPRDRGTPGSVRGEGQGELGCLLV